MIDSISRAATGAVQDRLLLASMVLLWGSAVLSGQVLWWSLALGFAAKAGRPISFWQFTRYGLIVAAITITLAMLTCGCATSFSPDTAR